MYLYDVKEKRYVVIDIQNVVSMEQIKSIDDVHQKEITKNELKMLNIGFSMGKFSITRDELHER